MAKRRHNPGPLLRTSSASHNPRPSPQPPSGPIHPTPAQSTQQRQPATTGNGFINPYNFVRFLSNVVMRTNSDTAGSPPLRTHEKFSGLSGRIIVELTTVTPLCIPDAEATTATYLNNDPKRPRFTKPFCRVDDTPYIPGSALKGMLRSVAEAVSNSCFSVLTKNLAVFRDNRSYVPGQRGVGLLSLRSSSSLQLNNPAPSAPNASGIRFPQRGLFNQDPRYYYPRPTNRKAGGQIIRDEIRDVYTKMIADDKFTLRNAVTQKDERPNPIQEDWLLNFGANEPWWFREANIPALRTSRSTRDVITFGRNFRYKWAYNPRKALPDSLHPCSEPHQLCPCCALFGMVEQRGDEETEAAEVNAFAGKIAVGPARWQAGTCDFGWVNDHKILGTPKFSCRSFYLEPTDKAAFYVGTDEFVYLDASGKLIPNAIRGRKFYWHHTKVWPNPRDLSYLKRLALPNGERPTETEQNARIEVLMPEAKFEFAIDFENLSEWELGLLLWAVALPDVSQGAHHLGLGKPLGLGTVTLEIKRLDLINRCRRYSGLFDTGVESPTNLNLADGQGLGKYVKAFRDRMRTWHGQDFEQLDNVKDLMAILNRQQPVSASEDVPIIYPPGNRSERNIDVNPQELHYQWFGSKGWSEPLRTIEEIVDSDNPRTQTRL